LELGIRKLKIKTEKRRKKKKKEEKGSRRSRRSSRSEMVTFDLKLIGIDFLVDILIVMKSQ
jgi:hypothetical protein